MPLGGGQPWALCLAHYHSGKDGVGRNLGSYSLSLTITRNSESREPMIDILGVVGKTSPRQ